MATDRTCEEQIPEAAEQKKESEECWQWIVLIGAFVIYVCLSMQINLFGLIYRDMLLSAEVSTTVITLIFNTFLYNLHICSLFAGPLCDRFGFRPITFICGLIIGTCSLISALIENPILLFVTYSLLSGMACGMFYTIPQCILPLYFQKRIGFAMGILFSGLPIGQIIGPILLSMLRKEYGRYAQLLISALFFNSCVAALTFAHPSHPQGMLSKKNTQQVTERLIHRPIEHNVDYEGGTDNPENSIMSVPVDNLPNEPSTSKNSAEGRSELDTHHNATPARVGVLSAVLVNLKLLRYYRVLIISFSFAFLVAAQLNFIMLIPFTLTNSGHSMELVTWGYSTFAVCNFVTRLIVPTLSDYLSISKRWYVSVGAIATCLSLMVYVNASTPAMILLSLGLFGVSVACTTPFISLLIIEFMGIKYLPAILGASGFIMAITFIVIGPIAGAIRDYSGSYAVTIMFLAGICMLSSVLWLLIPLALRLDKRNLEKQSTIKEREILCMN